MQKKKKNADPFYLLWFIIHWSIQLNISCLVLYLLLGLQLKFWTFGDDTVSGHENQLDYCSFVYGKDVEDLPWPLLHWPILYVQYLELCLWVFYWVAIWHYNSQSTHVPLFHSLLSIVKSHIKTQICDKLSLFLTIQLQFSIYYNKRSY